MSIKITKESILLCRYAGVTSLLWSHKGLGKSQIHQQITEVIASRSPSKVCGFIDLRLAQCESSDVRGMPDRDLERNLTRYLPPADLPQGEYIDGKTKYVWGTNGSYNPKKHGSIVEAALAAEDCPRELRAKDIDTSMIDLHNGILFLDEPNRAEDDVLQAIFQLVLDRKIGQYQLPTRWSIHCAANYNMKGYSVNSFNDSAFLDRFCHMQLSVNEEYKQEWAAYIMKRNKSASKLVQFALETGNLSKDKAGELSFEVEPTPRSLEILGFVDQEYKDNEANAGLYSEKSYRNVISGLIGHAAGSLYYSFNPKVLPSSIINGGISAAMVLELKKLKRSELAGLAYALLSNATDLKRSNVKKRKNVLDFVNYLCNTTQNKDTAVAVMTTLLREEEESGMAGLLATQQDCAETYLNRMPMEDKKGRWLYLLLSDDRLAKLLKTTAWNK